VLFASTVKKHGTQVTNGPTEVPGDDMVAQCMDPHAMFTVHAVVAG
jgi:predicted enzyme related to lactoylglutathione lyase